MTISGRSGADGSFEIANVPLGFIQVCAQAGTGAYLDPCLWTPFANQIEVRAHQRIGIAPVILPKGEILRIRIDDPAALLPARSAQESFALDSPVMAGVVSPVMGFLPLRLLSVPGAYRFEGLVPPDTPLELSVRGGKFVLADARGKETRVFKQTVQVRRGSVSEVSLRAVRVRPVAQGGAQ